MRPSKPANARERRPYLVSSLNPKKLRSFAVESDTDVQRLPSSLIGETTTTYE